MKPTQEQVIAWAREAGFEDYHWTSLSGESELDRTLQVGEYPVGEAVFALVALAYEAGRKDENEAIAQMIEDAPPLVDFVKNEHGGCVICGFTPKLAAFTIRERMRHE